MHKKILLAKTLIDSSGLCHVFDINAIPAIFYFWKKLNELRKLNDIHYCVLHYIFDLIVYVCLNVCIYVHVFIFILQYH